MWLMGSATYGLGCKSLEITGFGPVVLIDTPGMDDGGDLGEKRIETGKIWNDRLKKIISER